MLLAPLATDARTGTVIDTTGRPGKRPIPPDAEANAMYEALGHRRFSFGPDGPEVQLIYLWWNRYRPVGSTAGVDFTTTRPVAPAAKSHINSVVLHSDWEAEAARLLDALATQCCKGPRTRDVGGTATTREVGDAVVASLRA